jgi:hypothetical protein
MPLTVQQAAELSMSRTCFAEALEDYNEKVFDVHKRLPCMKVK